MDSSLIDPGMARER